MSYLKQQVQQVQKFQSGVASVTKAPELIFAAEAWLMLYMLIHMSSRSSRTDGSNIFTPYKSTPSIVGSESGAIFVGYLVIGTNKIYVPFIPVTKQRSVGMLVQFPPNERSRVEQVCREYAEANMPEFLNTAHFTPITCMFHHHVDMAPSMSGNLDITNNMYSNASPANDGESFKVNTSSGRAPHISLIGCISGLKDFNMDYVDVETSVEMESVESNHFFLIYNSPSQQTLSFRPYVRVPDTDGIPIITNSDIIDESEAEAAEGKLVQLDLEITTETMFGSSSMFKRNAPLLSNERITRYTVYSAYLQLIPNALDSISMMCNYPVANLIGLMENHILSTAIALTDAEELKKAPKGGAGSNAEVYDFVQELLK